MTKTMMEFYTESEHKARKPHKCDVCDKTIYPGSEYVRQTGKYDGDFFTRAWHKDCSEVMNYYFDFLSCDDEFDYDGVYYDVQESLCRSCALSHWENDECAEDLWHCDRIHQMIRDKYEENRKKMEAKRIAAAG